MDIRAPFFSPVLRVQVQKWIFQAVSKAILIRSFCALHRMTENLPVDVQMPALDSSDSFMSDCLVPFLGAFIGVSKLRTALLKRYLEHRTPCGRTKLISRPCLGNYIPVLKYSTLLLCMLWWLVNVEVPFWEGFKLKKCFQRFIKKRFKNIFSCPSSCISLLSHPTRAILAHQSTLSQCTSPPHFWKFWIHPWTGRVNCDIYPHWGIHSYY